MNIYCIIYNASGLITNLLKHSGAESDHSNEKHSGAHPQITLSVSV